MAAAAALLIEVARVVAAAQAALVQGLALGAVAAAAAMLVRGLRARAAMALPAGEAVVKASQAVTGNRPIAAANQHLV